MGYWNCEKDSDKTLFNNLGDHVPQSIASQLPIT